MKASGFMKKNSFMEGALIATLAIVITKILGMIYVIPFYRIIGTRGGALYSYAYNIYMIFLGVSSAGIPTAISKIISEYDTLGYKEAKQRSYKIGVKIISYISVIAFLVMFIGARAIAYTLVGNLKGGNSIEDVTFVIRCVSFAVLVIPYLSVTKGFLQGHRIMTPSSVSEVLEQVVRIIVVLLGSYIVYKVFSGSLSLAVGIAVSGAFFGGLASYIYLKVMMKRHKKELDIRAYEKKDPIRDKTIIKKIVTYAMPFIVINVASFVYNYVDMVLIIKGCSILGFSASDTEFIQSAITTWASKICMIITSFSLGMVISLIPNIVNNYVKKDYKGVEDKINNAYETILTISIPCACGLIILSKYVWQVFYGPSTYGPIILNILVISTLFNNLYTLTFNAVQSLNKFKTVYISIIAGFVVNMILDIPMMLLLDKTPLPSYWGTSVATIIGYSTSILIATHELKKWHGLSFKRTFKTVARLLVPSVTMVLVLVIFNHFTNFSFTSNMSSIIAIVTNMLIGIPVYLGIAYKMNILQDVFGKEYLNRIIKKLTFGKVSIIKN